jgi:C4-dicarboxylate transporter DctM subunit
VSPIIVGTIGLVVLLVLLGLGLPIGATMALVGFAGFWCLVSGTAAITMVATTAFDTVSSYSLAVLPLFILMAEVCFQAGLTKDLFNLGYKWLGHRPGGVAMATTAACAGFAAVSASSIATAATMGMAALPEMKKYNYAPTLATGCIAAGGSMGALIPPSGILIVYGILTETSIGKLFMAGFIPGFMEAFFYIITIYILCRWNPSLGPRGPSFSFREKVAAFGSCGEIIALIILVLGGLIIGWFTPTEAGAVGAFGAIILSLIRGRLNWQKFKQAILGAIKTTGMIYGILIGACILNIFLAISNIPFELANFVSTLPLPPLAIMGCILLIYLFLGAIMDAFAMILLTIPIFFPVALALGFDPIWFGIIIVVVVEMAMITPPIGMNVYVIAGIAPDVPMQTIFKGIFPFLIADIARLVLLLLFPAIALFLPNLM